MRWQPLLAVTAAAAVAAAVTTTTETTATALSPAVRQMRTPAGEPCISDDDCGGYAVTPALWCRAGFGSAAKTCREFVSVNAKCDSKALVCPRHERHARPDAPETVECRSGRCQRKTPTTDLGAPCVAEIGCEGNLSCRQSPAANGTRCVAASQAEGQRCDGPFRACAYTLKCSSGDDDGPATCQPVAEGDACGPGAAVEFCFFHLVCQDGRCVRFTYNDVGGVCGTASASCADNLPCVAPNEALCTNNNCPGGLAGTCRLPRQGDDCTRQNSCAARGSGLTCAPVEVVVTPGGGRPYARSECIPTKAAGEACDLAGVANGGGVCGTDAAGIWQLCIGGACTRSPSAAVAGDQCDGRPCSDGTECVYDLALTGLPVAVCTNASRGVGDSCTPPGTPGTEYCQRDEQLSCINGTCVAPESLPGEGEPCDQIKRTPCADTVGDDGSVLVCRRADDDADAKCRFQRSEGGRCADVADCLRGAGLECVDGACTAFAKPSRLVLNETCGGRRGWRGTCADGLVCRAIASRPRLAGVCVNNVTTGAVCDYELHQCVHGVCRDGVCTAKVPPGGGCNHDFECAAEHYCWRGVGATGATCRRWVGLNARCDHTAAKCWTQLTCDAASGRCKNPSLETVAGAACDTNDDCPGERFVCRLDESVARRVCKRLVVVPDGQCGGRYNVCPENSTCALFSFNDERCVRWVPVGAACGSPGVRCWPDLRCSSKSRVCERV